MIDRRIVEAWEVRLKVRATMIDDLFRYEIVAESYLNRPDGRKQLVNFSTLDEFRSQLEAQQRLIDIGNARLTVIGHGFEQMTQEFLHLWEGERDPAMGGR